MLKRVRPAGSILRESFEYGQVTIRGLRLVQTPLDHGELVVSGGRVAADFDISSKQFLRLWESLGSHAEICQFQKRIGIIRIPEESILKHLLRTGSISLPFGDESEIE